MKTTKWLKEYAHSLKGKWIALTGSTGGLGRQICRHIAGLGGNLLLLDRNQKRSTEHAEKLRNDFGIDVLSMQVDMQDMSSVKAICEKLKLKQIDYLILNAGAYSLPREKSSEGWDNVFQINFVSPYYIVKELLPSLEKKDMAKVIVVGSIAHKYSCIDETDIDFSSVKAPRKVYGNAKRFLMFSLIELLTGNENISLSIAHPGITPTNITSHYPKLIRSLVKYPMKIVFTSPEKASLNIIKGIFADLPADKWVGPKICNIWGKPQIKKLNSCDKIESRKIFEIAEKIYSDIKGKEKMKEHELGLRPEFYDLMQKGIKIYEGRLNDDKRKLIEVGDIIIIKKDPEREESFRVMVVDKLYYENFRSMAENLPSSQLGFEGKTASEIEEVYRQFYSCQQETQNGVVAIKVELINN